MKSKLSHIYKQSGLFPLFKKIIQVSSRVSIRLAKNLYFKVSPSDIFYFNGNKLKYFRHSYNLAYQNERTIEIAIANWFLGRQGSASKILEVGNVLRNYGCRVNRDVLDKYDLSPGILNTDVVSFSSKEKYDAIISVSTLEHVGWDEPDRDRGKIPAAIRNLKENCLQPGGTMLVTLPLGYNPYFDQYIRDGGNLFVEKYFLKRISAKNEWLQVEYSDVSDSKFDSPFNNANAMFVGVVKNL